MRALPLRTLHLTNPPSGNWLAKRLLTAMFRFKVKLTRTVSLEILETDLKSVTFRQKNYKKVQNHDFEEDKTHDYDIMYTFVVLIFSGVIF